MSTVILLVLSNIFMTIAWYGHLKYTKTAMWQAILISWGIAFFEYCLQVPANRYGAAKFDKFQLKIMQEVITLIVFTVFAILYFKQWPAWNHIVAFVLVLGAVGFASISQPGDAVAIEAPDNPPPPAEGTP